MADILRGEGGSVEQSPQSLGTLYDQPVLVVDPGMHTSSITDVRVDTAGRLAITGSDDKTVRVWSLTDRKLLRTIRMPVGPGNVGKISAVAMSPDGALVAAGGWTRATDTAPGDSVYLFETSTGKMTARMLTPSTTDSLAFSLDGRYLAVGCDGVRVYDRDLQWREIFQDTDCGDRIFGVAFAGDGRLATASLDGKIRLYER